MDRSLVCVTCAVLACTSGITGAFAQPPDTLWVKAYGGAGTDRGYALRETDDGGFIVVGETTSFGAGAYDAYLVRTDAGGESSWVSYLGGSGYEFAYDLVLTPDGGCLTAGVTTSFGAGARDGYVIRVGAGGDTLWSRTYGGASHDALMAIIPTSDGNYLAVGTTYSTGPGTSALWLLKLDGQGLVIWEQAHGGVAADAGFCVIETADNHFAIGGQTTSYGAGDKDLWLVNTDPQGALLWWQTYGGPADDRGYGLKEVPGGGFAFTGYTTSFGAGGKDIYLVRTDEDGNALWTRTYGGPGDDAGNDLELTADGGFLVAGYTGSIPPGDQNAYLVRANAGGDTLWTASYGVPGDDLVEDLEPTSDGGWALAGYTNPTGGDWDCLLIRLEGSGPTSVVSATHAERSGPLVLGVGPNPLRESVVVRLRLPGAAAVRLMVCDPSGRVVRTVSGTLGPGDQSLAWDRTDRAGRRVAPGMYFYALRIGDSEFSGRFAVVD